MRYFTNIISRLINREKKSERLVYLALRQHDLNSEFADCSSSDEDLYSRQMQMVTKGVYNMRQDFESSYEELLDSKRKIRKIRVILIILIVLFFTALITVSAILLVNRKKSTQAVDAKTIELERVISGQLSPKRFNGTWADDKIIYKDAKTGQLLVFDILSKASQRLISLEEKIIAQSFLYEKSPDGKYLLIARGHNKIFRYSFSAFYYMVDLSTGKVNPLTINNKEVQLLLAKWAPKGNALVVNFDRNLYYKPGALEKEIQLTSDSSHAILNGHPDWVYEEEVFTSNVAVWFTPNGSRLAYIQFNDTSTRVVNLPFYGIPGDIAYQYPASKSVFYPKAGSPNPLIKLYQIDLERNVKTEIAVPTNLKFSEYIVTAVEWLTEHLLLSVWMNRIQNQAFLQISNATHHYEIYKIESKMGWVDLFTPPVKNSDGSKVALILPQKQGTDGDFRHVHLISTKDANNKPISLSTGKFVVQSIEHWDYENNLIFYMANQVNRSEVLHLFAVKAESGYKSQCITCRIKSNGVEQTYFDVNFSPSGRYIIVTQLGPNIPRVDIYHWSYVNGSVNLQLDFEWESNFEINSYLSQRSLPEIENHTVDLGNGFSAKVLLQLPPSVDRSGSTKYPMLVEVYGGPDSYAVTDRWSVDWGTYLASNRSIIYAKIDGRGSGLRGDKHLHSVYLKLGTLEIYDQLNVTQKLQNTLPYVDASRTGIWGWSYGGYASAMALANDNSGIFKCATSVAPVTDWTYYDSIYTERFMALPKDNNVGYKKSRLTTLASRFKGKRFMLIHGTFDDNVHYQQSMIFAKNLEYNDVLFRQINYPDEDHGLFGVRPHLYHSLDNFFGECFNIEMKTLLGK